MGVVQRISKMLAALIASNAIALITQLLLPPIFLHRYGAQRYGEWLTLSAAVAYLSTLNFGIQTYVNQDLTVRYHRRGTQEQVFVSGTNHLEDYHLRQSTALRLLLGIVLIGTVLASLAFVLPVSSWLKLHLSQPSAAGVLFCLALEILAGILLGYFTGSFMVVGRAHRGYAWMNGQRLATVLVLALLAWFQTSFLGLALAQLAVTLVCIFACLIDLHLTAPEISPSLRYWDPSAVTAILKPSGHFALIFSCTFLAYQLPLLIMQRLLGPVAVVAFTIMRTIFSMARQFLAALTQSMGPEITRLYGLRDWRSLSRLYSYSERTVFSLVPIVNFGVLLLSPVLLALWLHRSELFSFWPFLLCAGLSTVMSAKEHKIQFQVSTNTHETLARVMFVSYLVMIVAAIPLTASFGLSGFLIDWLVVEAFQFAYIVRLNIRLFASAGTHDSRYLIRLLALSGIGFTLTGFLLRRTFLEPPLTQLSAAIGVMAVLLALAFPLFRLADVARRLTARAASA